MAMGMDWLGYSLAEVPKTHSRALKGVAWPTTTVAVAR
jgi:crossover junction endodeoxyribonuclease RuvC